MCELRAAALLQGQPCPIRSHAEGPGQPQSFVCMCCLNSSRARDRTSILGSPPPSTSLRSALLLTPGPGTYKTDKGNQECTQCTRDKAHTTTSDLDEDIINDSLDDCVCAPGYKSTATDGCQLCGADTYKDEASNALSCTGCPENTKTLTTGGDGVLDTLSDCVCGEGYTRNGNSSGTCVECAKGSYKDFVGNDSCRACSTVGDNRTTEGTGSESPSQCREFLQDLRIILLKAHLQCKRANVAPVHCCALSRVVDALLRQRERLRKERKYSKLDWCICTFVCQAFVLSLVSSSRSAAVSA